MKSLKKKINSNIHKIDYKIIGSSRFPNIFFFPTPFRVVCGVGLKKYKKLRCIKTTAVIKNTIYQCSKPETSLPTYGGCSADTCLSRNSNA